MFPALPLRGRRKTTKDGVGFLQGYTLTGRTGVFPTYESFLGIVHTMMTQYSKFNKMSKEVRWRKDISSINYIETSTWTRQEHNGFSHQNPSFIGAVLNLKPNAARVYLPPDPNTFLSTFAHCLRSKNYVNLIVGSKQPQPVWLDPSEADAHCKAGGSIWKFASTEAGANPDVVLVGIGSDLMFEVLAAAAYLDRLAPSLRMRVVNVTDLMILGLEGSHPHSLSLDEFDALFTPDRNIHFNYCGYANELQGLLFGRPKLDRITIESYREEGSTTTPFDMVIRNRCSRYDIAQMAIKGGAKHNKEIQLKMQELLEQVRQDMAEAQEYILASGKGLLSHCKVMLRTTTNTMLRSRGHIRLTGLRREIGKRVSLEARGTARRGLENAMCRLHSRSEMSLSLSEPSTTQRDRSILSAIKSSITSERKKVHRFFNPQHAPSIYKSFFCRTRSLFFDEM